MKNAYTYVSRIPEYYTSDDCVQLMIGYKDYMTMFDKEGVLYHNSPENVINVNKYLSDDRRFNFPYHDIPEHIERRLLGTYNFTNQLLNYEEPYVSVSGNVIIESMAILDKDVALVVNNILPIKRRVINVDRVGLDNLFKKDDETYILRIDGSAINEDYSFDIADEDDVVSWSKEILREDFSNYHDLSIYDLECSTFTKDWVEKNIDSIIENINIETVPEVPLEVFGGMAIVKIKDGSITVQVVDEVIFLAPNKYRVVIMDLPMMDKNISIDTLRMLNIKNAREPKISRRLNPNVDSELIKENKRLVRRLK